MVELLLVSSIISILVVLAVPQFIQYSRKAANSAAISDLKNLKINMESVRNDTGRYPAFP